MKAFIFAYQTNYDLGATIIYAETKKRAVEIAKKSDYIWDTHNIHEVDTELHRNKVLNVTPDSFVEIDFIEIDSSDKE